MSACVDVVKVGFYCIGKTVGKGNSSIVKHATHAITKSEVAIKIIDKALFENDSSLEKVKREIHALKTLRHPNIIKLYQVMESDKFIYLISEYVPNGEIFEYIANHGKFPEKVAKMKFAQIVNAVDYCHQRGVVHRDLKAENLLLDAEFNVKLADFGFSNSYHNDKKLTTWCGSPPYAAPEIFEGQSYVGPEVDIWSLGVILYVLVCGMLPFDGENLRMVKERVVSGRFRIPFYMSTECEKLLRKILVVDPRKRYSMTQIKNHVWLKEAMGQVSGLEESFREQLVVTGRGVSLNCHDIILKRMQEAKIDKDRVLQSLENHRYDNFSAIYELLLDRIARHIRQYPQSRLSAAGLRRPSMISEQVMLSRRVEEVKEENEENEEEEDNDNDKTTKVPTKLVETREAAFSQTTDGVLLQEVAGPLCQLQQRIRCHGEQDDVTKEMMNPSGGGGMMIMPTSPIRPKLTRSPRLGVGARGRKKVSMTESSIDEGVETEEEGVVGAIMGGGVGVMRGDGGGEGGIFESTSFDAGGVVQRPPCHASSSIDSNIEVDFSHSNIFSPLERLLTRDEARLPPPPLHLQPSSTTFHLPSHDLSNFRKGRRASEGVVMKLDSSAVQNLFLKNRACGLSELRKELVKLQNQTVQQPQLNQLCQELQLLHNTQQQLQHLHHQPQTTPSKEHKPLINNSYLINKIHQSLEEQQLTSHLPTNPPTHRQFRNLPYHKAHSPLDHQPRPLSPLKGSFKRHFRPLRPLPPHLHHRCPSPSYYADIYLSSASTSPIRGTIIPPFSPSTSSSSSSSKSHTPQPFYNANLSSYPPSVCQSGSNILNNSALGSPHRKPSHPPTSIFPLHISAKQHLMQYTDQHKQQQQFIHQHYTDLQLKQQKSQHFTSSQQQPQHQQQSEDYQERIHKPEADVQQLKQRFSSQVEQPQQQNDLTNKHHEQLLKEFKAQDQKTQHPLNNDKTTKTQHPQQIQLQNLQQQSSPEEMVVSNGNSPV